MGRRPRSFATAPPVLLLLLVLALWARSYLPDRLFVRSHRGHIHLFFTAGQNDLMFTPGQSRHMSTAAIRDYCHRVATVHGRPVWQAAGFEAVGITGVSDSPCYVAIPYWSLALAALAASGWWLATAHRRAERSAPGHCHQCGYDLRGSDSGRCPECGTAAPAGDRAAAA